MFFFLLVLVLDKGVGFYGHQMQGRATGRSQARGEVQGTDLHLGHKKMNFWIPWVQIPWIYLRIRKTLLKSAGPQALICFPQDEQDQESGIGKVESGQWDQGERGQGALKAAELRG